MGEIWKKKKGEMMMSRAKEMFYLGIASDYIWSENVLYLFHAYMTYGLEFTSRNG